MGWTINLGHPRGALVLMAIVAIILVLQLVVTVGVMNLASNEGIGAVDNPVFVPVVIGMIVIDGLIVLGLWRAVSKRPVADHRKHPPHSTQ